eukprot:CAMPEP_0185431002 /NCGR_PEP_ID=MMETSP1365-20130426/17802_1 /TAXON_ID=38817 /ORGANISM="Gephyrocapsa oceanica, Strain RCC1303" /LENGTH=116 /DNA_ID=CAMNT_0028035315 /DNA_START=90 /DNA_END=437 /DNA_ORIENTATION=-
MRVSTLHGREMFCAPRAALEVAQRRLDGSTQRGEPQLSVRVLDDARLRVERLRNLGPLGLVVRAKGEAEVGVHLTLVARARLSAVLEARAKDDRLALLVRVPLQRGRRRPPLRRIL